MFELFSAAEVARSIYFSKMKSALLVLLAGVVFTTTALAKSRNASLPPEVVNMMNAPATLTLLSIHPDSRAAHWFNTKFHGYRVLGQIAITNATQRRQVSATLKRALAKWDGETNKCVFSPRHGVRVTSGLGAYDFLICFECQELEAYMGERRILHRYISGKPGVLTTLLRAAHIRIAD